MIDSIFDSGFQTFCFFVFISNFVSFSTFADLNSLEKENKILNTILR